MSLDYDEINRENRNAARASRHNKARQKAAATQAARDATERTRNITSVTGHTGDVYSYQGAMDHLAYKAQQKRDGAWNKVVNFVFFLFVYPVSFYWWLEIFSRDVSQLGTPGLELGCLTGVVLVAVGAFEMWLHRVLTR